MADGFCNDETNNEECLYDGGDCCGSCVNRDYCTNCFCIGNVTGDGIPNALVGNGFCEDETNNAECNYDLGDCCYTNINTELCSECVCYYEETCAADAFPKSNKYLDLVTYYSSFNDGICNNETRE